MKDHDKYEELKQTLRQLQQRGDGGSGTAEWIRKEIWMYENYGKLSR